MLRFTLYFIRDKIIHQIVIPHGSFHLFSPHELTVVLSLSCLSSLAFSLCFRTLSAIRSFRRFCKQFSESSPCLPGQQNNCGTLRKIFTNPGKRPDGGQCMNMHMYEGGLCTTSAVHLCLSSGWKASETNLHLQRRPLAM